MAQLAWAAFFFNKNLMVPQLPLVPKVLRFDDP